MKNERILIADDVEENLYFLDTVLKSRKYETKSVKNGEEALNELRKNSFDLIISDILMPKMDGFQLCRECKKNAEMKNIPFIFYTATYTEKKDEEFALSLGADKFIIKPQEPDKLLKIISEVLKESKKKDEIISKKYFENDETAFLSGYSQRIVKKLEKKVEDLSKEISIRKQVENNLNKRVKELNCLYHISSLLIMPSLSLEELFEDILEIIPIAWQFPESACGRIIYNGREYKTENFKETIWGQKEDIKVSNNGSGSIEVYYLEEKPLDFEGPFLREERNLLKSISEIITTFIERIHAEEKQKESFENLQKIFNGIIYAISSLIELKDPYTADHQRRVNKLAVAISKELSLDEEKIKSIGIAALIHDIGKISVPASILSKPGKISDIEFDLIKTHPVIGYNLLEGIKFNQPVGTIILQHHERLDGSGYPYGLKDKDILFESKIIIVADVVEAMASHRPYRPALGIDAALEEIVKNKGKLYDSVVVDTCVRIIGEKKFTFD